MTTVYRKAITGELYPYEWVGVFHKPDGHGFPGYATLSRDGEERNIRLDTIIVAVTEPATVVLRTEADRRLIATVTPEGLACDCGKGVLCPLNPQTFEKW